MNRKQRRQEAKKQRGQRATVPARQQAKVPMRQHAEEHGARISGSHSASQDAIPRISISPEELKDGALRAHTLHRAIQLFRVHGFLLLEDVFSERYVENLNDAYCSRYANYFGEKASSDALEVGDLRKMISVDCRPPFSDSRLYANPLVLPLLKELLGRSCVFASLGSVVSLPGSPEQHLHADHPRLFKHGVFEDNVELNDSLPPFAITMITPLVELNSRVGTTRVYLGSHINYRRRELMEFYDPVVPKGSCYLFDYRLYHGGTANKSNVVRPILYNIYYRHWFQDRVNYEMQAPLVVHKDVLAEVSDDQKGLFAGRWEPYGKSDQLLQRTL